MIGSWDIKMEVMRWLGWGIVGRCCLFFFRIRGIVKEVCFRSYCLRRVVWIDWLVGLEIEKRRVRNRIWRLTGIYNRNIDIFG